MSGQSSAQRYADTTAEQIPFLPENTFVILLVVHVLMLDRL
ncbi:MAG TPA: hypothetical protein VJZ49_10820 [Syntrophales bacterium]|nr:hypothetical protein [Syntrophales bacterium]